MCGVRAAAIGESEENDKEISEGKYNIVYGGAEQWLNNRWKKCLQYGGLHQSKVLVVDEVHTIETWYVARIFVIIITKLEVTIARKVLPHPQGIKGSMHNLLNKGLFV